MPIPLLQPPAPISVAPPLVAPPAPLATRFAAHIIDFCCVLGSATWLAKVASVLLLACHARGFTGGARRTQFLAAYDYSVGMMLVASLAVVAAAYFVALPVLLGRTPGMALFGLRYRSEPTVRELALRLLGCVAGYWIAPALTGLIDGQFPADRLSGTQVVKD